MTSIFLPPSKPCLTAGNLQLLLANSGASQLETPQRLRAFVVLQTQVTMNLFLVIVSLAITTPLQNVVNPVISNGSALRMVPEMIWCHAPNVFGTVDMEKVSR